MSQTFIGIDCGISGAIAIITPDRAIQLHDCPIAPKTGKFNRHDSLRMHELLLPCAGTNAIAIVESVHFDWRDEAKKGSAEVLVRSHEAWLTLLQILGIPCQNLYPVQWRKLAGCDAGWDKAAIVRYACKLYPAVRSQLKRRSSRATAGYMLETGKAEALLMAHAAQSLQGEAIA